MRDEKVIVVDAEDPEQVMELVGYDFGVSRRGLMKVLGAGVLIAVAVRVEGQERRGGRGGSGGGGEIDRRQRGPVRLDARVHLGKDGAITIMTGKVECGQGARAEIAQVAAEELGVPVEKVGVVLGDTGMVPDDGLTAGSRTTPATVPAVRQACAAVRKMKEEVAKKRGVESITYAELAGAEELTQVTPGDVEVRAVEKWEVMGKDYARPNGTDLVTGAHVYPRDVKREGMVYGKVLRPGSYGAKLVGVDEKAAEKVAGAKGLKDGDFVGVVAPSSFAAKKALLAVEGTARWEEKEGQPSSAELVEYLRKKARDPVPASPFGEEGKAAAKVMKATYFIPYVQHVPMEARAAVAEWDAEGRCTIWTSTQHPFGVRREVAGAFHIPEEKVRVIVPDFGGGFGGKHTGETAVEAARLARAAGRPVSLQWTRAEEFEWASFRPAGVMDVEATLDSGGGITSWQMINLNSGPSGVDTPYRVKKSNCRHIACEAPLRHGSYRALASTANHFARESFMDELAHAMGRDPLEYRLALLDNPRVRAVLEVAAEKFGWKGRKGKGMGLACGVEKGGYVATCAEVEVDGDNKVRVKRVVQAFECGKVINPENLKSQNQGAIVQGLGPVLREEIKFEGGRITNGSLADYEVPKVKDVPAIEVHLLDRPDLPSSGAGETPLVCVAPAVGNAVFDLTGTRVRELPIRL